MTVTASRSATRRAALTVALAAILAGHEGRAAAPLDEPHVGGIGVAGPTSGDLSSVYWNPATLALLGGSQLKLVMGGRWSEVDVARASIDPATGVPGGSRSFPAASGDAGVTPFTWPPGPGTFIGAGLDLVRRFTLAITAYAPFVERVRFRPTADGQLPTSFHRVEADLRHLAVMPVIAFRIGNDFRVGIAPGFMLSSGRFVFDHDTALEAGTAGLTSDCGGTPCGAENPAAASRQYIRSSLSPFDASTLFTFAVGVHYRFSTVSIGAAYASRPLGRSGGGIGIDASRSYVQRPTRDLASKGEVCPLESTFGCVSAELAYALPDIYTAGVTWAARRDLELTAMGRWIRYSVHDDMTLRIAGPAPNLEASGLPERIVLYRGFQDVLDARVRAVWSKGERFRVGAQLRVQTSAVPKRAVSPAAIDGLELEPAVFGSVRLGKLELAGGYAFAFMVPVDVTTSAFDPAAARACADGGGDLALPACQTRLVGAARPTAAGRYERITHTLSVGGTVRF